MFKILLTNLLFLGSLYAGSINIAVAANVSYAIDDLKKEFNKIYPNTNVRVTRWEWKTNSSNKKWCSVSAFYVCKYEISTSFI